MTEYQVTRWRELPSGRGKGRDEIVETDADDYLAGGERTPWITVDRTPVDVLDRVTSELDAEWPADRIAEHLSGLGR